MVNMATSVLPSEYMFKGIADFNSDGIRDDLLVTVGSDGRVSYDVSHVTFSDVPEHGVLPKQNAKFETYHQDGGPVHLSFSNAGGMINMVAETYDCARGGVEKDSVRLTGPADANARFLRTVKDGERTFVSSPSYDSGFCGGTRTIYTMDVQWANANRNPVNLEAASLRRR